MAKLKLPKITGTTHNVTVYWMRNQLFLRSKTNLNAERVKSDPAFQPTMAFAALMAMASPIGSRVYQTLKPKQKKSFSFQFLTGKALKLLKQGLSERDVLDLMMDLYGNIRSFIQSGLLKPASVATHYISMVSLMPLNTASSAAYISPGISSAESP